MNSEVVFQQHDGLLNLCKALKAFPLWVHPAVGEAWLGFPQGSLWSADCFSDHSCSLGLKGLKTGTSYFKITLSHSS